LPSDKHFKASHRREQHKKRHDSNSKRFREDVTPSLASVVPYHTSPWRGGNKQRSIGPILWSTVHRDGESPRRKLFRSRSRERKDAKYNEKQIAMCHKKKAKKKVHSRKTYTTDLMVMALQACHDAITNKTKTTNKDKNKKDEEKKRKPTQNESLSQNSEGKRANKRRRGRSSSHVLSAREIPAVMTLEEKENDKMNVNDTDVESSCLGKEMVASLSIPPPALLDHFPNFSSSNGTSLMVPPPMELPMVSLCPSSSNGSGAKEMLSSTKETAEDSPPQGTLEEEMKKEVWRKSEHIKSMNHVLKQLRDEASKNNTQRLGSKTPTTPKKARKRENAQDETMKKKKGKKVCRKEKTPVPCTHSVLAKEVVEEPVSPAEEALFLDLIHSSFGSGTCASKKKSSSKGNNNQKKGEVNEKNGKTKSTKQVGKPRAHQKGKNKKGRGGHGIFDEKDGFFDEKGIMDMGDFFIHHHPLLQVEHKRSRRMRKRELLEAATRAERGYAEDGIKKKQKAVPVERAVVETEKDMGQNPTSASPTHLSRAATVQNTNDEKPIEEKQKQKKQVRKMKKQNTGWMEKKEEEAHNNGAGKCSEEKQKKKEKKEKKKEEEREERKIKEKKEQIAQKEGENAGDRDDGDDGWTSVGGKKKQKKTSTSILRSTTISTSSSTNGDVFPIDIKNQKGTTKMVALKSLVRKKKNGEEEEREGKLKEEKAKRESGSNSKKKHGSSGSKNKTKQQRNAAFVAAQCSEEKGCCEQYVSEKFDEDYDQLERDLDELGIPYPILLQIFNDLCPDVGTPPVMVDDEKMQDLAQECEELGFIDLSSKSSTEWHLLSSDTTNQATTTTSETTTTTTMTTDKTTTTTTKQACTEVSIITTTTSKDKDESKNRKHFNTCKNAAAFCDEWLLVDDMDEGYELLASPEIRDGAAKKGWDFDEIEESRKLQQEFEEWICID